MMLSINSTVLVQINPSEVVKAILHHHLSCRCQFCREVAFSGPPAQQLQNEVSAFSVCHAFIDSSISWVLASCQGRAGPRETTKVIKTQSQKVTVRLGR